MKFIILKDNLKRGISIVEKATTKFSNLPILNNILIKAEKNFLNLAATNLEIGVNWWFLAKIEREGKIAIPVSVLSNFVNLLPNQPITLEKKDLILSIESEKYKAQLKGSDPNDFPIIPQIKEKENIIINAQTFCQGLSQVVDIPVPSPARPEISGIYLFSEKNLIKIAATDSFRLGEKILYFSQNTPLTKSYSLILPQRTAKEIINIFSEREGELKIYFSPNQIQIELPMTETNHPQVQLVSKLIEGEYPNYQEIIPKKYKTQVVLQKNEFLNQVKTASLFSGKINEIKFEINSKENKVEIFSQTPDLGQYHSFLPGKIKGEKLTISFNGKFLIDGLLKIKSSELILELSGPEGAAILRPVGDTNYFYVVMPIKASV